MPRAHPTLGQRLPYGNLSRHSGVLSYELTADGIILDFHHQPGHRYLYTTRSVGPEALAHMTALARAGRGLSTFVSRHVHNRYARKLPSEPDQPRKPLHN